jgi:dipeptidase E
MNNLLLASTSTLFGQEYLSYLLPELKTFFQGVDCITFVPYARPGGCSEHEYTQKVRDTFGPINIEVIGLDEVQDPIAVLKESKGIFTGGGNTFLLVQRLYELDLIDPLNYVLDQGVPYLGTSAGSNICGWGMHTTNDMPIVHPPSLKTLGRVPFNLNVHYIEPERNSTHMGETRETRIREFQCQQKVPVVGIPEGTWLRVMDSEITVKGAHPAVVFPPNESRYDINTEEKLTLHKAHD